MAVVAIKHSKVVTVPDDGTSPVGSDEWNANHVITGLENVQNVDTTNASNITSGTLPVAVGTTLTGHFYAAEGARIHRLADRVFIGDAVVHTGEQTFANNDWLTTFQISTGRASGFIQTSQAAVLNGSHPHAADAVVFGAQTKNLNVAGFDAIGSINIGVNNNSTTALSTFASYNEAYRMAGAIGGAYGLELDPVNYASSVSIDPFSQNIGQTIGLQLAAGAGLSSVGQFASSAAINIRNNNSNFLSGIIFGNDAIGGTNGTDGGFGVGIEMATGHTIDYYYGVGSRSWRLAAAIGANGDYNFTSNGSGGVSVPLLKAPQVKFPAIQSASSDPNTLDDYEEGTFTPVLSFGALSTGITYSTQVGRYTKIGNVVTISLAVVLTSKGSAVGSAVISGLPFNVQALSDMPCSVRCNNMAAAVATQVQPIFVAATATVSLGRFAAGATTIMADTDFTNTTVLRLAGQYFVD